MGEYELFYETEAVQKKITRLTQEYERQIAGIIREAMNDAWQAGYSAGSDEGYHAGYNEGREA